jgi:lipopolysaccharide export system permease protein
MPSIAARYMFRTAGFAFVAGLSVLTAIIWTTQALRQFDLLTTKGQTILLFLHLTGLIVPSLVAFIAPVALFLACLYTLNRLNGDSELVVMAAAGMTPWRLLSPLLALGFCVTLVNAFIALVAMPWSFRQIQDIGAKVRADIVTRVVSPGQFVQLEQGFVFHYRERGANGALLGIFMQDQRDKMHVTTYIAEVGQTIETKEGQNFLVLDKGSVQRQQPGARDAALVVFDRYAIDLAQFAPGGEGTNYRPRERSTAELLRLNYDDPYVKRAPGRFFAELNDRFTAPLYGIVAVLAAFLFLGQARTTRQGRGWAIIAAVLLFGLLRTAGIWALTLLVATSAAVVLVYAIPLLACGTMLALILSPAGSVRAWLASGRGRYAAAGGRA